MFISAGVFSTLLHFFRPALDKRNKKQTNKQTLQKTYVRKYYLYYFFFLPDSTFSPK